MSNSRAEQKLHKRLLERSSQDYSEFLVSRGIGVKAACEAYVTHEGRARSEFALARARGDRARPHFYCEVVKMQSDGEVTVESGYVSGDGYAQSHVITMLSEDLRDPACVFPWLGVGAPDEVPELSEAELVERVAEFISAPSRRVCVEYVGKDDSRLDESVKARLQGSADRFDYRDSQPSLVASSLPVIEAAAIQCATSDFEGGLRFSLTESFSSVHRWGSVVEHSLGRLTQEHWRGFDEAYQEALEEMTLSEKAARSKKKRNAYTEKCLEVIKGPRH